jgi:hypothetical protein
LDKALITIAETKREGGEGRGRQRRKREREEEGGRRKN